LLVLRDEPADEAAIAWLLRLAWASGADVTILPVVPSLPALYALGSRGRPDLGMLLAPNTAIGCKIRRVASTLQRAGIHSLTRQRRGTPDRQIWEEAAVGDPDLIVIGAESGGRIYRWFAGELVPRLLHWRRRPVLIANVTEGA
jgi:nucleotide-binding universal stress UspA family protein